MQSASTKTPRVRAEINGVGIDSVMHTEFTSSGSCRTSQLDLTVSVLNSPMLGDIFSLFVGRLVVELFMRVERDEREVSMFIGLADSVTFDPVNGTARIVGRDYSSVLINSSYQYSFCNQTSSEIASYIAARHGLSSSIVPTFSMVGSHSENDHNKVLLNTHSRTTNEWDLLKQLAETENYELYVKGTCLFFAPAGYLHSSFVTLDRSSVVGMRLHKDINASELAAVTVKSWNSWLNAPLHYTDEQSVADVNASDPGLAQDIGATLAIVRPNLTSQETERIARLRASMLNDLKLSVQIVMPGDLYVKPGDVLKLDGIGAGFDVHYSVRSVRRSYSATAGFMQYLRGVAIATDFLFEGQPDNSLDG